MITSESGVSWTDDRRPLVWLFLLGGSIWMILTLSMIFAVFSIIAEDYGLGLSRKYPILFGYIFASIVASYFSVGVFQMFFLERRNVFIVWKITLKDDVFSVMGLFGKKCSFGFGEIELIGVHKVKNSTKNIMTLLAWHTENYLIKTKDGREFYLSKDMDKDGGLIEVLEGKGAR